MNHTKQKKKRYLCKDISLSPNSTRVIFTAYIKYKKKPINRKLYFN
jgi:hypothetical protein